MTARYDQGRYSVEEEVGPVTLALVLDKAVPFLVTVTVRTLDLLDTGVGDAASGELLEFCLWRNVCDSVIICSCLPRTNIHRMIARM